MSDLNQEQDKSRTYIVIFTTIVAAVIILVMFVQSLDRKNNTTAPTAQNGTQNAVTQGTVTRGSMDAILDAEIKYRDIDFSFSKDDVKKKEAGMEDTIGEPIIASGTDGYEYYSYSSNPDNPLKLYGVSVSDDSTSGLSYVFINDSLSEIRLQFGSISPESVTAIVSGFNSEYGQYTFYRSMENSETYWWKTNSIWLMLSRDSAGTTVFFRQL